MRAVWVVLALGIAACQQVNPTQADKELACSSLCTCLAPLETPQQAAKCQTDCVGVLVATDDCLACVYEYQNTCSALTSLCLDTCVPSVATPRNADAKKPGGSQ